MQHKIKYIQDTFNNANLDVSKINSVYALQQKEDSGLAIKLLSIFGGIFSSIVFVIFIAISGMWTSGVFMEIFGALIVVFSIFLNVKFKNLLLDTFTTATYIVGVIMIVFGMNYLKLPENNSIFIVFIIGIITLIINQTFIFSFIASLMVLGSLLSFIFINDHENSITIYIVFNAIFLLFLSFYEANILRFSKKTNRLLYAVKMAVVISLVFSLSILSVKNFIEIDLFHRYVLSIGIGIIFLFTVYKIVRLLNLNDKNALIFISIISFCIALLSLYAPTIIGALILILIGFYNNSKVIFAIGILSFIAFTGMYYYNLNETLLFKSILLSIVGMVFLGLYVFIIKNKSLEKI